MPDNLFEYEIDENSDEELPIAIHGYISEPNGVGTNSSVNNPDSETFNFNGKWHSIFKIPTPCGLTVATAIQALTFLKWHGDALIATYCTEVSHAPNNVDSDSFTRDIVSLSAYSFLRQDIISSFIASRSRLEKVSGTTVVDTKFFEKLDNAAARSGAAIYPESAKDDRDVVFPIHVGKNHCILGIIMPKKGEIWVIDTLRSYQTLNDLETNLFVKLQHWCEFKFPHDLDWKMMTFDDLPNLTRIHSALDPQTVGKHPHQTDGRSCGVFVAIYAHYFITEGRWPTVSDWTEADIPALRLFMAAHFSSVPMGSVPEGYCDMAVNNIAVTVEERGNLLLSDAIVAEGITHDFVAKAFGSLDDKTIQAYVKSFIFDLKAIILMKEVNKTGTYTSSGSRGLCCPVPRLGACSDVQQDVVYDAVLSYFPADSVDNSHEGENFSLLHQKHGVKWFTDNTREQLDFVLQTLVPEAILRLHMAVLQCTRDTVERMLSEPLS